MNNIIEALNTDSKVAECLHCQLRDTLNGYYRQTGVMHGDKHVLEVDHALKHLSMIVAEVIATAPTETMRNEAISEFSDAVRDHVEYLLGIGAVSPSVMPS